MTAFRPVAHRLLLLACTLACVDAAAQTTATTPAPVSAAERAQQQADRPLYWIRLLADKPAVAPAKAAPAVAAPAARPVPRPAVATAETRPPERVKVAAAAPAEGTGSVVTPVRASGANPLALASAGGLDAGGVVAPAMAAGLAARAAVAPALDIAPPPAPEEPDPGLAMVASADPQFPLTLMRRLRKGTVEVRFEVGADGQVAVVSVEKSSHPGLNDAALAAVRQWRFKPTPQQHVALVDLAFDMDK